jgi:hypothetical protein
MMQAVLTTPIQSITAMSVAYDVTLSRKRPAATATAASMSIMQHLLGLKHHQA